ncbi:MAG: 30S ribosomal protein S15 [Candidatus Lokiarchaeota archaeon]|nr:30S ribosomal protein S15 [Candidatus Lokiarchaeota archaeon]MBD3198562.1 30S ribosomal protein S15 [Candidatus Lokiarchaeota archaeon]
MARLHSRKKGKSGSTRPARLEKPVWIERSPEEIEAEIVKSAKKGLTKSMIGVKLRDAMGVPLAKVITGKKIGQTLKENGIEEQLPEDLTNLIKKALNLRKHLENNKKDLEGKKGLQRTESKIYRLIRYYKDNKVLAKDFKYDSERVRTMVAK